jgi:HK97 family phage portal protein
MSILNKIARKNLSMTDPKAWDSKLWNLIGNIVHSGENVSEWTAMTYSAFYNAVYLISETIAGLPLHLMRKEGKNKVIVDDDNLYYLMHDRPNPFMTSFVFREVMTAHILTWGNGYAEKVKNLMGEIVELWPIPPNRVKYIEYREEDNNLWYGIQVDGEIKWLPRDDILHIPGFGFDGFIGYSIVSLAKNSIGLGMAMETFGAEYFGQGTHPGVIVSHPGKLNAQTRSNMQEALTNTYSGLGKAHKLMLLEEGLKIEKLGIPPNDSQFLESRQFQIPEMARWFNLPPHKLKDLTKSSFNNIESEQISFVTDSILPWALRKEQNYNIQLLTDRQRRQQKYFWKHNFGGLLRANSKDRADFYKTMIGNTIMSPNDVRELEDLNPSDNPLANELFVQVNMIPLSKMDEYLSKNNVNRQFNNSDGSDNNPDSQSQNSRMNKLLKLGG